MRVCLVRPPTFIPWYGSFYPYALEALDAALKADKHDVSWIDGETVAASVLARREGGGLAARAGTALRRGLILLPPLFFVENTWRSRIELLDALFANDDDPLWEEIVRRISGKKPEAILLSCYSASMSSAVILCRLIRRKYSAEVPIVLGGAHPTSVGPEVLENVPEADYAVMGEGEETIRRLLEKLAGCGGRVDSVAGLCYRNGGAVRRTTPRGLIGDLGDLPVPDFEHAGPLYRNYVLLTSRGCPFNCRYCASKVLWTKKVRFRPPEHVAREVSNLRRRAGVRELRFGDDTFTLKKEHVGAVASALGRAGHSDLSFSVGSRIDTMNGGMLRLLKDMNVWSVSFGVETGSRRIMETLDKGCDLDRVIPTVRMVNEAGIRTLTYFMINHPGETREDMLATLALVERLNRECRLNTVQVNTGFPYPGTPWWSYCEGRGLLSNIDFYRDSYRCLHQSGPVVNMSAASEREMADARRRLKGAAMSSGLRVRVKVAARMLAENPARFFKKVGLVN